MNVDRLQQIVADVRRDLQVTELEPRLSELETALQQQESQPGQESVQAQVDEALNRLTTALELAPSNAEGALWWHLVSELNLTDILPRSVKIEVSDILSRRLLPMLALQQIRDLRRRIGEKRERLDRITESLSFLGIQRRIVPPGKAQISILIPRAAVEDRLDDFGEEAQKLNVLLNDIIVAGTGDPEDIKIQALSTSEFMVDVLTASQSAVQFATALAILVGCYVKVVRLHRHAEDLTADGVPSDDVTKLIGSTVKSWVTAAVNEAAEILLDSSKPTKTQRNDRLPRTKRALKELAERLNKGYNFDVQPSDDDESAIDGASEGDSNNDSDQVLEKLLELRKAIQFVNVPGKRILELPAGDVDGDDDATPQEPAVS